MPAVPASVIALLPIKGCPACWPVYAGILSSLGMGFLLKTTYLMPLTILFLITALFALGYRARRRWGYGPLIVGLIASVVLLVGKFFMDWNPAVYAGFALLIVASFWNAWPGRRPTESRCGTCTGESTRPGEERR
jgi:hypothetical protein